MSGLVAVELVVVAMLVGAMWFLTSRRTKGRAGEWMVGLALRGLDSREYRVLNNIYLPLPDGTTSQIDHIVVSRYGLFVIETKNYRRWVCTCFAETAGFSPLSFWAGLADGDALRVTCSESAHVRRTLLTADCWFSDPCRARFCYNTEP